MMLESGKLRTEYPGVVGEHNTVEFFMQRVKQLKRITSVHMFPIEKAQFGDFPIICYECRGAVVSGAALLGEGADLLPSELKSLAWQLAKLFLHCQQLSVSHLRLCPEAVVLGAEFAPGRPLFVRVRDFAMGKEFGSVAEGKMLGWFEYLHPELSVGNGAADFERSQPRLDLWSLGVLLYQLVYKRSPFCKEGRRVFSKTVLRRYLAGEHEVHYLSSKFASVNQFIAQCLGVGGAGFGSWGEAMEWMVREEEIYNALDFHDGPFEETAEMHLRLMALFAGVYCLVLDQCAHSPHPFWRKPISPSNRLPFHLKVAEFTLRLMKVHEDRFQRIYGAHLPFLRRKDVREALAQVSRSLEAEL